MCNKMDYNPLKKRVFAISILNILLTITLSVGGLYLLMPVIMHFQPNWKVIYCGYYKTSLVANIIVTILIALIGVILSVYLLLVIGTKALENYTLIDSYHCSRYNTNTGRLTNKMFDDIFIKAKKLI